jgi:hypothetical protein
MRPHGLMMRIVLTFSRYLCVVAKCAQESRRALEARQQEETQALHDRIAHVVSAHTATTQSWLFDYHRKGAVFHFCTKCMSLNQPFV